MPTLPKKIKLRLTKSALARVPDAPGRVGGMAKKEYVNNHRCLVCESVRERFPDVFSVTVVPGGIQIDGVYFFYNSGEFEDRIERAHENPEQFKSFTLPIERDSA